MNTKTVSGLAMLAVAATPFAASAQSMAELIAKNPSLAAILAPYMAQSTSTASCAGTITKSLKKGMTDAEIVTLQSMLNASADTAVATSGTGSKGMESSYFGAATKAAVIKFQNKYASEVLTPNGLTVGTGMVGAATRAKLNALCATATTPATTTTAGNTTSTTGLQGTAGSASVTSTSVDVDTDTYKVGQTKKAIGFKIEATGSDVNVTNIRVKMNVNGTGSDRLTAYAKEVVIFANGVKVGSLSADAFSRDSAGVYSANIAVSNAIVKMGTSNKVTFHVGITAVDAMDSDDINNGSVVANLINVRYVDASGVTLSDNTTLASASISFGRVASDSDVKFRLVESSNNPSAKNIEVSKSNSTNVVLATFKLKAEKADMSFDKVSPIVLTSVGSSTGAVVSDVYLKKGDVTLASTSTAGTTNTENITFILDSTETIKADDTQEYSIVARVNKVATGYITGNSLQVAIDNTDFNTKTVVDGKNITSTNRVGSSVTTYAQSFMTSGLTVAQASKTTGSPMAAQSNNGSASNKVVFGMELNASAFGSDDLYIPLNAKYNTQSGSSTAGVVFKIVDGTGAEVSNYGTTTATFELVSGGTQKTDSALVTSGNTAKVKLTVTYVTAASGSFRVVVSKVGYATTDTPTASAQVTTSPVENFRTDLTAGMTP